MFGHLYIARSRPIFNILLTFFEILYHLKKIKKKDLNEERHLVNRGNDIFPEADSHPHQ